MTNGFIKTVGKKTKASVKGAAKKVARVAREEQEEYLRSAKAQITKEPTQTDKTSVVDEIVTGDGKVSPKTPGEEEQIKRSSKQRLEKVEQELSSLRQERKKAGEQWRQEQEAKMVPPQPMVETEAVVLPTSPQKGPQGPAGKKKTKGTGEMIKSKK